MRQKRHHQESRSLTVLKRQDSCSILLHVPNRVNRLLAKSVEVPFILVTVSVPRVIVIVLGPTVAVVTLLPSVMVTSIGEVKIASPA